VRSEPVLGVSQLIDLIGVPKGACTSSTDQCGAREVGHFSFRGFSRVFGITVPPTQHLWSGPLMQDPCASTCAAFWVRRADCRPSLARRFSAFSCPVGPAVDIGRVGALWAIEVVAKERERREGLVRILARDLLDTEFQEQGIPLRRYDLSVLLRPFTFPTDPADGIESVRVNQLRLMPIDNAAERVTLECTRQTSRAIWEMARERFHVANPLADGWIVTQAKLTIKFHPDASSRRGRTLPLTITMPHGCDLKDRTERERIVGNKYLRTWGILRDV
jgi:hypothetical protein